MAGFIEKPRKEGKGPSEVYMFFRKDLSVGLSLIKLPAYSDDHLFKMQKYR